MPLEILYGDWKRRRRRFVAGRVMAYIDVARLPRTLRDLTGADAETIVRDAMSDAGLTDGRIVRSADNFPGVEIKMPVTQDSQEVNFPPNFARTLAGEDIIEFAEPVFLVFSAEESDDEYYLSGRQQAMKAVRAHDAWADGATGTADVLIGIADSGIPVDTDGTTLTHPDILDASVRPITLGRDYVAEWTGAATMNDEHGHGTHILGIIAADTRNTIGVAGVNWHSPVYVIRVLDHSDHLVTPVPGTGVPDPSIPSPLTGTGAGVVWAVVEIVNHARGLGVKAVINLSLGSEDEHEAIRKAFEFAKQDPLDPSKSDDVLICVSAGNEMGGLPTFPAELAADRDYVVAVGSTDNAMTEMSSQSALGAAITVVAPGEDIFSTDVASNGYYYNRWGTSMATGFVTGIASLMWSRNLALTPAQIKCCLKNSSTEIPGGPTGPYRGVDAARAVSSVDWLVEPESLIVAFFEAEAGVAVHRNISFLVESCSHLNFRVTAGPVVGAGSTAGSTFTIPGGDTYEFAPAVGETSGAVDIQLDYVGAGPGDKAWATVTIECVETTETWTFYLVASVRPAENSVVMMALDLSGSMDQPSGFFGLKRYEVLRESVLSLLSYIPDEAGIGLIRFDDEAVMKSAIDAAGAHRQAMIDAVNVLAPDNGYTSIGNALDLAEIGLKGFPTDYIKGTIVMTDGRENTPKLISDAMEFVENPVYAIAMGTPENINTLELNELAGLTGGYVLLTGDLEGEDRFKVLKYYMQIYTNITGDSVVVDPAGFMHPDRPVQVPFCINNGDQRADIVLMTTAPELLDFRLIAPDENEIAKSGPGIKIEMAPTARYYRCDLTKLEKQGLKVGGRWQAVINIKEKEFNRFTKARQNDGDPNAEKGVPYNIVVQARSPLRMHVRLQQSGFEPGDTITVRASLKDAGFPVTDMSHIHVTVNEPDGTQYRADLKPVAPGHYEVTVPTDKPGIYVCRVIARGTAMDQRTFMREQTLTGAVWQGGNTPSQGMLIRPTPVRIYRPSRPRRP